MFIMEKDINNWLSRNNVQGIDSRLVKPVNMDDYAVASKDKPILFTLGLATCIGLVATSKDFAFLAHIDMGGLGHNGFEEEWSQLSDGKWKQIIKSCKVTRELYNKIYQNRENIKQPIELTVVLGSMPVEETETRRIMLERGIDSVVKRCSENLGIAVNRLPNIKSQSVLVDSKNGEIIIDKKEEKTQGNVTIEVLNKLDSPKNVMKSSKALGKAVIPDVLVTDSDKAYKFMEAIIKKNERKGKNRND